MQATLGTAYTVERELGGGGMSRVFVATETRLGRRVVVKVLHPEIGRTTVTLLVQHETQAERDAHLNTGMEAGMQDALDLLEQVAISLG